MANAVVNRQVNVYINSGEAAKAYDVLIKREKLLNAELAKTTDPKRIKQLTAELDKLKDPIDRAAKKMKGELAPSIRELELATRKFLNEFKKTGDPETLRKFQQFQAELNKAKLQLNDLGTTNKGLTSMGIFKGAFWANLAAGGIMAATSAISNFFTTSIDEALAADEATTRLRSTLDNLGRSDVFDRIINKANDLAGTFRYLDNDDIVGVFNKLIDYGKLTQEQMDDLLPVIIDFAAKSQISIDESASIIIKALEGNGKALKEYGINIKDAGSDTERLNVIMTTLKSKVDGSGEAFMKSAKGGLSVMRQESANLKEELGNGLLPMLNKVLEFTLQTVNGLKSFFNAIGAELKGNSGFIQIALDEVEQNPELRKAVLESADATVKSVMSAQSQIEQQLGRKLNLRSKEDADMLKKNQELRIKGIEESISRDNDALAGLVKSGRRADQLEARSLKIMILARTKALEDVKSELNPDKKTLGINAGSGGGSGDGNAELEKAIEERKRLIEELKKIKFDQSLYDLPAFDKEMKLVDQKYGQFRERAKGDKELMLRIEELYLTEKLQLIDTYTDREVNAWQKANEKIMSAQDKQFAENLKRLSDRAKEVLMGENDGSVKKGIALTLQNQADDEAAAKARAEHRKKEIQEYIGYASQITSILSQIGQSKTEQENAELERDRLINAKKIKNLDGRLKKGVISQQQYDKEVQKIEKEQEKREKQVRIAQFQRQKRQNIVQAIMNTAEGVTEAYPNLVLAAIIAASGIAQVALISSQKPPEFAAGGRLGGRSHSSGGNAVIDGSGRKIAEVEAGEGIVNKRTMADRSRYSLSGTPSQIISRLNGMYGTSWEGGATLIPGWRSYSPQRMNYTAMKRMYADGGIMASNSGNQGSDSAVFENLTAMISDMQATQAYLATVLANGIVADVSLTRFEDQQKRLTTIRRDAALK